jgi:putative FmdB family regulatory protein
VGTDLPTRTCAKENPPPHLAIPCKQNRSEAAMPVYDYECEQCGPFTTMRPMAECDLSSACPRCRAEAPRAFLTAPYFAAMPAGRRAAMAANERSAHAPQQLSKMDRRHGPGCGCCTPKSSRTVRRGRDGAKGFPASRPWMISH